jgi:hypothetical protein
LSFSNPAAQEKTGTGSCTKIESHHNRQSKSELWTKITEQKVKLGELSWCRDPTLWSWAGSGGWPRTESKNQPEEDRQLGGRLKKNQHWW